jgi:hypothetical protein
MCWTKADFAATLFSWLFVFIVAIDLVECTR